HTRSDRDWSSDVCSSDLRAVAVDGLDLGFVDILSYEGVLDHPLSGPREELYWRRSVVESSEPPRSLAPVVEPGVAASVGAVFQRSEERRVGKEWRAA